MTDKTIAECPPDAVQYLYNKYIAGDPESELYYCEAAVNSEISSALYDMREAAGLTQQQLAEMIGTKKSAISRIEDGDYKGHSLGMLRRVADVLGYKVSVKFEKVNTVIKLKKRTQLATKPAKDKTIKPPALAKTAR